MIRWFSTTGPLVHGSVWSILAALLTVGSARSSAAQSADTIAVDTTSPNLTEPLLEHLTSFLDHYRQEPPVVRDSAKVYRFPLQPQLGPVRGLSSAGRVLVAKLITTLEPTLPDYAALAVQFPAVATDAQRAGLTPRQVRLIARSIYDAILTDVCDLAVHHGAPGTADTTTVVGRNVTFVRAHQAAIEAIGWFPPVALLVQQLSQVIGIVGIEDSVAHGATISVDTGSFPVAGQTVTYQRFRPRGRGTHPAVVLLHGAGGPELEDAYERPMADSLAAHGYVVEAVHYYDRTETRLDNHTMNTANFGAWEQTVSAALTHLARDQSVDSTRIGILGVSNGATLALAVASYDRRVGAVVEFAGTGSGVHSRKADGLLHMAPTLIVHGTADSIIPVREAYALDTLLTSRGVEHTLQLYAGQRHVLERGAYSDALARLLRFFALHLAAR